MCRNFVRIVSEVFCKNLAYPPAKIKQNSLKLPFHLPPPPPYIYPTKPASQFGHFVWYAGSTVVVVVIRGFGGNVVMRLQDA